MLSDRIADFEHGSVTAQGALPASATPTTSAAAESTAIPAAVTVGVDPASPLLMPGPLAVAVGSAPGQPPTPSLVPSPTTTEPHHHRQHHQPVTSPPPPRKTNVLRSRNVFIANLPRDMTDAAFRALVAGYGALVSTRLAPARDGGGMQGFALMARDDEAQAVIRALNGSVLQGHKLQARISTNDIKGAKGTRLVDAQALPPPHQQLLVPPATAPAAGAAVVPPAPSVPPPGSSPPFSHCPPPLLQQQAAMALPPDAHQHHHGLLHGHRDQHLLLHQHHHHLHEQHQRQQPSHEHSQGRFHPQQPPGGILAPMNVGWQPQHPSVLFEHVHHFYHLHHAAPPVHHGALASHALQHQYQHYHHHQYVAGASHAPTWPPPPPQAQPYQAPSTMQQAAAGHTAQPWPWPPPPAPPQQHATLGPLPPPVAGGFTSPQLGWTGGAADSAAVPTASATAAALYSTTHAPVGPPANGPSTRLVAEPPGRHSQPGPPPSF